VIDGLLILSRRQILWLGGTAHLSAEWIARQLTEACGWEWNRSNIIRDHDVVFGEIFRSAASSHGHWVLRCY
jgi:hypothetical protein